MPRLTRSATSVESTPRAPGKWSAVALRIVAGVIASGIASSSCHQHMHCASSHEATTLEHVCDSYINGACVGYGDQPRTETVCDRWECDDPTGKNCSGNCANKSAVSSGGGPNLTFRYAGLGCTCPAVLAPGVPSGGPCRESADCAETCCTCGSGSQHDAFTSRVCLDGHLVWGRRPPARAPTPAAIRWPRSAPDWRRRRALRSPTPRRLGWLQHVRGCPGARSFVLAELRDAEVWRLPGRARSLRRASSGGSRGRRWAAS